MRGFLLTLDALFALAILVAGLSFFAVQAFSEPPAAASLYVAGRDVVTLPSNLQNELATQLDVQGFVVSRQPLGSRFSVQAKAFEFQRVCEGAMNPDAACLQGPDAALTNMDSVVWVGVR